MTVLNKKRTRRSARGNWLVVELLDGKIFWCTWVRTWAAVTEGADQINDLYKLWEKE